MTRTQKYNDRDHAGLADGSAAPEEHLPRYFAKSGHVDSDPKKTKKEGSGKGNWYVSFVSLILYKHSETPFRGKTGDEAQDYGYNFTNARRRSNSSTLSAGGLASFKTKFEAIETDPVFEEAYHGAPADSEEADELGLEKEESAESTSGGSIEEEDHIKKV